MTSLDLDLIVSYPSNQYEFSVFNRWGQMVFRTSEQENGWNGTFKNEAQPIGTYFYIIKLVNAKARQWDIYRGDVTLDPR